MVTQASLTSETTFESSKMPQGTWQCPPRSLFNSNEDDIIEDTAFPVGIGAAVPQRLRDAVAPAATHAQNRTIALAPPYGFIFPLLFSSALLEREMLLRSY